MISFREAFEIVMNQARTLDAERVELGNALNRILAEDVRSDVDMPPFRKSTRDGYACRREDLAEELTVIETIQAGGAPTKPIGESQCSKIMTGAMVPEGADCVVMVEFTERPSENTIRFTGTNTADNICRQGEDINAGDIVLHKGERIGPPQIAVLAAVGCVRPRVSRQPRVGIIETGDELVPPDVTPKGSQIRASNGHLLHAQLTATGSIPTYYGIAKDTEETINCLLKRALAENDVVLVSGGVSMGDLDLVPDVMKKNNIDILFDRVAVKPGKPTTFGISTDAYCFGLPGNPVSTFVQFELLVKPFLYLLQGHHFRPPHLFLPLAKDVSQKPSRRDSWVPVTITEKGEVVPCDYHGSAHINALCDAEGLICIPGGTSYIEKGTLVDVRII
jgi:molybdopterin molybdotransferase